MREQQDAPQHLRHDDQYMKARCFPVDVDLGEGGSGSGYVVRLLRKGKLTTDTRLATDVQVFIVDGSLEGMMLTFAYFPGVLQAPPLH